MHWEGLVENICAGSPSYAFTERLGSDSGEPGPSKTLQIHGRVVQNQGLNNFGKTVLKVPCDLHFLTHFNTNGSQESIIGELFAAPVLDTLLGTVVPSMGESVCPNAPACNTPVIEDLIICLVV